MKEKMRKLSVIILALSIMIGCFCPVFAEEIIEEPILETADGDIEADKGYSIGADDRADITLPVDAVTELPFIIENEEKVKESHEFEGTEVYLITSPGADTNHISSQVNWTRDDNDNIISYQIETHEPEEFYLIVEYYCEDMDKIVNTYHVKVNTSCVHALFFDNFFKLDPGQRFDLKNIIMTNPTDGYFERIDYYEDLDDDLHISSDGIMYSDTPGTHVIRADVVVSSVPGNEIIFPIKTNVIINKTPIQNIYWTEKTIILTEGDVIDMPLVIEPADATTDVRFLYGNGVIDINIRENTITALSEGVEELSYITTCNGCEIQDRILIYVKKAPSAKKPLCATINKHNLTAYVGKTYTLSANVSDKTETLVWAVSDDSLNLKQISNTKVQITPSAATNAYVHVSQEGSTQMLDTCFVRVEQETKKYKITYNYGAASKYGIESNPNPTTYNAGDSFVIEDLKDNGAYSFQGWFTDKKCTKQIQEITKDDKGNKTLYAKWEPIKHIINFVDVQNTTLAASIPEDIEFDVTTKTFKLPVPKKDGYKFTGWLYRSPNASFIKLTSIKKGAYIENVTLFATWKPIKYKVTCKLAGGKLESVPKSYLSDKGLTLPIPVKEGYDFTGWKLGKEIVTSIPAGSTGNKTVTATWDRQK